METTFYRSSAVERAMKEVILGAIHSRFKWYQVAEIFETWDLQIRQCKRPYKWWGCDRLFDRAKFHTSAGVYMSRPWPMETILLSIFLEHGKMIEEILGLLKRKEA